MTYSTILVVEDDPGHARIIERSFGRHLQHHPVLRFASGNEVLDYLHGRSRFMGRVMPEQMVMLLDLNMPGLTGFEVMEALDTDARLRTIPRIIITTSDEPVDVERSKQFQFITYMVKPLDYMALTRLITNLEAQAVVA